MVTSADDVESIARQTEIEYFYERTGREFWGHKHVAEKSNSLACEDRFNSM